MTYGIGEPLSYEPDPEIQKWLHTKDFRIALSVAIDREVINETVFFGTGKPKNSTFSEGHPFYPGEEYELKYTTYDPDLALQLLDELGLVDTDGDGFRNRTDGSGNLTIELAYVSLSYLDNGPIAQLIKEYFAMVGVDILLTLEDVDLFIERRRGNAHQLVLARSSDRHPLSMSNGYDSWYAYGQWYYVGKQTNGSIERPTADPTGDPTFLRVVELTDMSQQLLYADRADVYKELQQFNIDNQWFIGIVGDTVVPNGLILMRNNLKNVPLLAPNQTRLQPPGIGRTQTWFFEGGKNDSE
jgi:peptide/nickel transport system substrate-binding protein